MVCHAEAVDVVVGDFRSMDRVGGGATIVWLVRPDGYLAAMGGADSLAYLDRVFIRTGLAGTTTPSGPVSVKVPLDTSALSAMPLRPER